jgi:hypothetical protein
MKRRERPFAILTLTLQSQRTTFGLLDSLNIEVVAHNFATLPVTVQFSRRDRPRSSLCMETISRATAQ